jgi:hypothetical protein
MERLTFDCPRTGRAIDAGIQTDKATLVAVRSLRLKLDCPYCGATHDLPIQCARTGNAIGSALDLVADNPKPPALSIAINALRIFFLRQGLH